MVEMSSRHQRETPHPSLWYEIGKFITQGFVRS